MKGFLLCLCLFPLLVHAQRAPLNPRLKRELDSLYRVDQVYRAAMFADNKQHLVDSLATALHLPAAEVPPRLLGLMLQTDSTDMQRIRAIIQRYGYPGKTLVGTPTNEAAFYVIQHSSSIPQYLPLIKQAADQGELLRRVRQRTIEPVFGNLLHHYGLRRINVRGQAGAHKSMLLAASAYNLKKLLRYHPKQQLGMALVLPLPPPRPFLLLRCGRRAQHKHAKQLQK